MNIHNLPMPPRCTLHPGRKQPGCLFCRAYETALKNRRVRMAAYGITNPRSLVPAAPTRRRLRHLCRQGMHLRAVARATGRRVDSLGKIKGGRQRYTTVATEEAVKRVQVRHGRISEVPSVGTIRRIQALCAMGYGLATQARWYGLSSDAMSKLLRSSATVVTRRVAARTVASYEKYAMVPAEGWVAERTRRWAQRCGFMPPLAWDDDIIDDPRSRPQMGPAKLSGTPDESAVWLALHYQDPGRPLNHAEKRLVIRHGVRVGMTHPEIAELLGIEPEAVHAAVRRNRKDTVA